MWKMGLVVRGKNARVLELAITRENPPISGVNACRSLSTS
jgi:hypothetical protein